MEANITGNFSLINKGGVQNGPLSKYYMDKAKDGSKDNETREIKKDKIKPRTQEEIDLEVRENLEAVAPWKLDPKWIKDFEKRSGERM